MKNIYYTPEAFGLQQIGEAEFSSGSYEFDTTVVWRDVETGEFFYAEDSGCSCPTPFESHDRTTITKIERLQDLLDHLTERMRGHDDESTVGRSCIALVNAYLEAKS